MSKAEASKINDDDEYWPETKEDVRTALYDLDWLKGVLSTDTLLLDLLLVWLNPAISL
jgi:hypothetical protein